jgi:hypothetical protein
MEYCRGVEDKALHSNHLKYLREASWLTGQLSIFLSRWQCGPLHTHRHANQEDEQGLTVLQAPTKHEHGT